MDFWYTIWGVPKFNLKLKLLVPTLEMNRESFQHFCSITLRHHIKERLSGVSFMAIGSVSSSTAKNYFLALNLLNQIIFGSFFKKQNLSVPNHPKDGENRHILSFYARS